MLILIYMYFRIAAGIKNTIQINANVNVQTTMKKKNAAKKNLKKYGIVTIAVVCAGRN